MLKTTFLEFDEKNFKQGRGTAIGTIFARRFAILFMTDLEEKFSMLLRRKL